MLSYPKVKYSFISGLLGELQILPLVLQAAGTRVWEGWFLECQCESDRNRLRLWSDFTVTKKVYQRNRIGDHSTSMLVPVCTCLCSAHLFWSGNTARWNQSILHAFFSAPARCALCWLEGIPVTVQRQRSLFYKHTHTYKHTYFQDIEIWYWNYP